MKSDRIVLIYSMFNNLIISLIKILGGIFFHLSSLLADGMHTFSDFITDIISYIGSIIVKKKPTKYHPFGFGKVEYLANLFVGIILFLLGIFIIISLFFKDSIIPDLKVLILLGIVFILKLLSVIIMYKVGKNVNSNVLLNGVKESSIDLYSTILVFIITVILQFSDKMPILKYSDVLGTLIIAFIVFKTSFKILIDNSLALIGEVDDNKELTNKIENIVKEFKSIKDYKIILIKYGYYYRLQLNIELLENTSLKEVTKIENQLKKLLVKNKSLNIKYLTILVTSFN